MSNKTIVEAVRKVKSGSKKRKFLQSIDVAISLRDVNLKDPSKRFRVEILLPHSLGRETHICVIGDAAILSRAANEGIDYTLNEQQIENLAKNPKEAKEFISKIDYFLSIPQLMAVVGKNLGRYLGPAGKMPSVIPPNADLSAFVTRYSRMCTIRLRQNPVIHCRVGTEDMDDEELAANIHTILNEIEGRLEQGANNIRMTHIKTTMGPSVALGG